MGNNPSTSKNPCLCLCWMTLIKNCTVVLSCERDLQIPFLFFAGVNFAVPGRMSSLCKGFWWRYPQARSAWANSESNATEVDNVLLLQHVILGSVLLNRAIILLIPKSQAPGSVICFIEASIFCLEHTHRSQSTSFCQWRHAKMLKMLFAGIGL